jgi:hypothetical protein
VHHKDLGVPDKLSNLIKIADELFDRYILAPLVAMDNGAIRPIFLTQALRTSVSNTSGRMK